MNARQPDSTEVPSVKSPEEELLNLLATQSRRLPIPVFAVLAVIGGLIHPHSPNYGWAVWLMVVLLVLGLRYAVLVRLPHMDQLALPTRVHIAALMSGINGIAHSSSLIFFPDLSDIERAIQSLILAGLAPAAIACFEFEQVMQHVMNNAIEAMPSGGVLTVRTFQKNKGRQVQVEVKDQGIGISKEILPRVFDPFFSTGPKGFGQSAGLGLSVAQTIIRAAHGDISIKSSLRRGTVVTIVLPSVRTTTKKA